MDIKIGGLKYKVEIVEHYARDYDSLGSQCGNNCVIRLDKNLEGQVKDKVLLHEIIEAINFEYELSLEHNKICTLTMALYDILKNNELFKDF